MRSSPKPVRKCHSCGLNLGKQCGVFTSPHDQWAKGKCPGFKNEELLKRYVEDIARHPGDSAKAERQERAKLARSTPHWQGDRHVMLPAERSDGSGVHAPGANYIGPGPLRT